MVARDLLSITKGSRALTALEFHELKPAATEWFANIDNPTPVVPTPVGSRDYYQCSGDSKILPNPAHLSSTDFLWEE